MSPAERITQLEHALIGFLRTAGFIPEPADAPHVQLQKGMEFIEKGPKPAAPESAAIPPTE